jgi:RNA polymerase sigma factor (sigma-70 family)
MGIAVHVILSLQRDGAKEWLRTVSPSALDPSEWEDISAGADTDERLEEIFEAMDELAPRQREVFKLRYIEHFKGDKLAELLGVSKGSAAAMASLSKKKLVEALKRRQKKGVVQ